MVEKAAGLVYRLLAQPEPLHERKLVQLDPAIVPWKV